MAAPKKEEDYSGHLSETQCDVRITVKDMSNLTSSRFNVAGGPRYTSPGSRPRHQRQHTARPGKAEGLRSCEAWLRLNSTGCNHNITWQQGNCGCFFIFVVMALVVFVCVFFSNF